MVDDKFQQTIQKLLTSTEYQSQEEVIDDLNTLDVEYMYLRGIKVHDDKRYAKELADLKKQNRYLRASLNRICSDVSNGELIDKKWIEEVLMEQPYIHVKEAYYEKIKALTKEVEALQNRIDQALAQEDLSYGMPEDRAVHFRMRKVFDILGGEE